MIEMALLAVLEAVAWQWRMRAAMGRSALASAASCLLVCMARVLFVLAGVSACMRDAHPLAVVMSYAVPAAAATMFVHSRGRIR